MRIIFQTAYFKHARVRQAADDYRRELERLSSDNGTAMMAEHAVALEAEIKELRKLHQSCETLSPAIRNNKKRLLNKQLSALQRALSDIQDAPETVLDELREPATRMLQALNQPGGRVAFTEGGEVAGAYIQRMYGGSREDTKQRYEEMDYWYALDNEYAINDPRAEDRAYKLALMPKSVQHAKWRFMLALADVAYNITYNPDTAEDRGPTHHALLSRLLNRLSMHERGASNSCMPDSHKYRHNPAIHSLHVVALADKVFHEVRKRIEQEKNGHRQGLLIEWRKMRDRVMLMALLHDMGELDGELSQGIDRATMTEEAIALQNAAVAKDEETTFARHLEQRRHSVPVDDKEWESFRKEYTHLFHDAENTDIFIGRFLKSLERMQSQHDYLRFEGINNATRLCKSGDDNKRFSLSYVSKTLFDAPYDSQKPGPKALKYLVPKNGNAEKTELCRMLCEELTSEYGLLLPRLVRAFEGEDPGNTPPPGTNVLSFEQARAVGGQHQ